MEKSDYSVSRIISLRVDFFFFFSDLLDTLFLFNVLQLSQKRICFLFSGDEYQFCLEYYTAILCIKSTQIVNGAGFFGDRYEH